MNTHPNRRTFLRLTGSSILVGLAGCTTGANNDNATQSSTDTTTLTPRLTPKSQASESTTTTNLATPARAEGATAGQIEVEMITDNKGSYFNPKGLLTEVGTTIQFVNVSGSHASTAYHPEFGDKPLRIPKDAEPWDSGIFTEPGKLYEVTFEEPGVYDYYCPPHEVLGMVGRIIVDEPKSGPGTASPTEIPPAAREKLPEIETIVEDEVVAGP